MEALSQRQCTDNKPPWKGRIVRSCDPFKSMSPEQLKKDTHTHTSVLTVTRHVITLTWYDVIRPRRGHSGLSQATRSQVACQVSSKFQVFAGNYRVKSQILKAMHKSSRKTQNTKRRKTHGLIKKILKKEHSLICPKHIIWWRKTRCKTTEIESRLVSITFLESQVVDYCVSRTRAMSSHDEYWHDRCTVCMDAFKARGDSIHHQVVQVIPLGRRKIEYITV